MTEPGSRNDEGISLFALGTVLLRNRWRIAGLALLGAVLMAATVITQQREWVATAAFVPQGGDATRTSGLSSLAGQLGFALPSANPSASVDFYLTLLKSPSLLRPIVRDTFVVPEKDGQRIAFLDLFDIRRPTTQAREEVGVETLRGLVGTSVARPTGIVTVTARTPWPSVSLAIVAALVQEVNDFNLQASRSQASAERKFIEGRLGVAAAELRQAEDRLQEFFKTNRTYAGSPELNFQHDRLRREVNLRQEVYTRLMTSHEEVRVREVRDTPVITILETPSVPTQSAPRGRVKKVALGLFAGLLLGLVIAVTSWFVARRRAQGDSEFNEFMTTLADVRRRTFGRAPWVKSKAEG